MDNNLLARFESMTDDQLAALVSEVTRDKTAPAAPQKVSTRLPDGTVIEADSHEALNQLLVSRLTAAETRPAPEAPRGQNPAPITYDYDTFVKKFTSDPYSGLDYLDEARQGFSTRQVLPQMLQGVAAMAQRLQTMETQMFAQSAPDFTANRSVVENIVKERGWAQNTQSYQDALDIAKSRGLIAAPQAAPQYQPQAPAPQSFIPPRTQTASAPPSGQGLDTNQISGMSDSQVEELMLRAGLINQRRF